VSLHYIVDGYNVIQSSDRLASGRLRDQRDKLLAFIEQKRPHGSLRNRITVVFDGQPDVSSPPYQGNIEVVFSEGPSADTIIKRRADAAARPRDVVVVTNDKAVRRWAAGAKTRLMSCEEFLAAGERPSPRSNPAAAMDPADVEDINDELKRLWKLK
jgi:predicted RNA-binding protein with PIN domain